MNIGIVIQARVGSTRLPSKVLNNLPYNSDLTVLSQVIRRTKASIRATSVIIATTELSQDDAIVEIAKKEKAEVVRGSETDVLGRYVKSAREMNLETVVRITSDCPCIDPLLIDEAIESHFQYGRPFTANTIHRHYPRGMDTEVIQTELLLKLDKDVTDSEIRENRIMAPLYLPDKKHLVHAVVPKPNYTGLNNDDIRLTLDEPKDYALMCEIYDDLYSEDTLFSLNKIADLLKRKPWLRLINADVIQKHHETFASAELEIAAAKRLLESYGMLNALKKLK